MFFEVSGVEVSPLVPFITAFVLSFFTSMGGVSGAFLLLPFQVSVLGFTSPAVSATNQLYNIIAIPGGVIRYIREGRMVWPLTWIVVIGTLPGVFIGAVIRIKYLPDPANFKFFAAFVLLYIGYRLAESLMKKSKNTGKTPEDKFRELVMRYRQQAQTENIPRTRVLKFSPAELVYEFYGEKYRVSSAAITLISFVVGIAGGIYGIGGGAIMAPVFVALFRLPVYTVAGAALMGTLVTSVAGVVFYQALDGFYEGVSTAPDWMLGLIFGLGGFAGIYLGARFQKFFPANVIKWILVFCIGFVAIKYIIEFFT